MTYLVIKNNKSYFQENPLLSSEFFFYKNVLTKKMAKANKEFWHGRHGI